MNRNQRTMLKLSASEESVLLRTISRGFRSPQRFIVLDKELQELEEKRYFVATDIRSFVEMHLEKVETEGDGDTLKIRFTWLSDAGAGKLSGTEENLRFSWERFKECIKKSRSLNGTAVSLLSIKDYRNPVIEFQSRKNLKAVVSEPILRRKLGKFLSCHFAWKSSRRIVVYDDFEPYSFFFREERQTGMGICGGIILHGRDNLKKAYYGMHT